MNAQQKMPKICRSAVRRAQDASLDGQQFHGVTRRGHEVALGDTRNRAAKVVRLDSSPAALRVVERFEAVWRPAMPHAPVLALEWAVIEVRWAMQREGRFEALAWWYDVKRGEHPTKVFEHAVFMREAGERWMDRKRRTFA